MVFTTANIARERMRTCGLRVRERQIDEINTAIIKAADARMDYIFYKPIPYLPEVVIYIANALLEAGYRVVKYDGDRGLGIYWAW